MNNKLWCGTILVCSALLAAAIECSAYISATYDPMFVKLHDTFTWCSAAVGIFGIMLLVSGLFSKSEPRP